MKIGGEIQEEAEGWERMTDMLRASIVCFSWKKVLENLNLLMKSKRVKIMRIKPRFGPQNNNLNDVTINYDYEG